MSRLRLTLGIATYRRRELLEVTLRSVAAAAHAVADQITLEALIGNDDVSGPLPEWVASDFGFPASATLKVLNRETNLGEVSNMNSLVSEASGEWVSWLGDDDLWSSYTLAEFLAAHKAFPSVHAIYPAYGWVYGQDVRTSPEPGSSRQARLLTPDEAVRGFTAATLPVIGVYGFFRRDSLLATGGMERLSSSPIGLFSEQLVFFKTVTQGPIAYIPMPLVWYRAHSESWGVANRDVAAYREAGPRLVARVLDIFGAVLDQRTMSCVMDWAREQAVLFWLSKSGDSAEGVVPSELSALLEQVNASAALRAQAAQVALKIRLKRALPTVIQKYLHERNERLRRRGRAAQSY